MKKERNRIRNLLETVADGDSVDWAREKADSTDDTDRRSLELLEAIAGVSAFHQSDDLLPGTLLGDLAIRSRLGRGSFGDVYLARDVKLERDVAIKLFRNPSWKFAQRGEAPRFLEEARRLARIRHPNVVTIHAVGMRKLPDGTEIPTIVLEPVHGVPLDELVQSDGPRGAGEIVAIGTELCRALAAVHAAGIVHEDLKPQNVMREDGGRIVLMDFGPGGATPLAMAPEIFAKKTPTVRSDLYGLGVILFYLATGKYPVDGQSFDDLAEAHIRDERRSLRDARPDLPSDLVRAIERTLAPDPAARFASAGELERVLVDAVGIGPHTPAAPPPHSVSRKAFALASLAVLTLAILFVAKWQWRDRRDAGIVQTATVGDATIEGAGDINGGSGPSSYEIAAAFYRGGAQRERVSAGSGVAPGDSLSLVLRTSAPVWFYLLNEDEGGESYVLQPGVGFTPGNPLAPDVDHVLPGKRGGRSGYWEVTSRGGRERLLLVASPRKLEFLESEVAGMTRPSEDRPVVGAPIPPATMSRLRGLGGYAMAGDPESPETARLFELAEPLAAGQETVRGVWIRGIALDNP